MWVVSPEGWERMAAACCCAWSLGCHWVGSFSSFLYKGASFSLGLGGDGSSWDTWTVYLHGWPARRSYCLVLMPHALLVLKSWWDGWPLWWWTAGGNSSSELFWDVLLDGNTWQMVWILVWVKSCCHGAKALRVAAIIVPVADNAPEPFSQPPSSDIQSYVYTFGLCC